MRKNTIIIIIAAVVVFIAYSFTYLDFQFSTSSTHATSDVSIYKSNSPTPNLNGKVYLYIQPDGPLEKNLVANLESQLNSKGAQVNTTESLPMKFDDQAVLIAIQNKSISYNPFIPRSTVSILIYYTLKGNTTYFEEFVRGETPVISFHETDMIIEGEIKLTDSTNGVISLAAYRKHIAESLASETFSKLPWGETP